MDTISFNGYANVDIRELFSSEHNDLTGHIVSNIYDMCSAFDNLCTALSDIFGQEFNKIEVSGAELVPYVTVNEDTVEIDSSEEVDTKYYIPVTAQCNFDTERFAKDFGLMPKKEKTINEEKGR